MNNYLIARCVGGVMEIPEITYQHFEIIDAETKDEAIKKYNNEHKCSYFYATCLAEKVDNKINILNKKVNYEQLELLVSDKNYL